MNNMNAYTISWFGGNLREVGGIIRLRNGRPAGATDKGGWQRGKLL
jgi:hypothetical protein